MSASTAMAALATVLPASTTIADTLVEKGISADAGNFPAIIINCPRTHEQIMVIGGNGYQEVHTVHVLYLDRWETSTRTLEQCLADARAALEQMKANVRGNRKLTITGVDQCLFAGETIDTTVDGAAKDEGLGFPLITAELVIDVKDFWRT